MATKAKEPVDEPDNLAIWNALSKTDPKHTKAFKRSGGFSGTAIKPIWITRRLTEQFGPCGKGWGMDVPTYQLVPGENKELLVYSTVTGWYIEDGERCLVIGVGGDKVITYIKANEQYNRPERWDNDDEAFKKAFTDALGNAFKFIGVGADVHMGQFDDNKYVQAVAAEYAQAAANDEPPSMGGPAPRTKLEGPFSSKTALKKAIHEIHGKIAVASSTEEVDGILKAARATIRQAEHDWPELLNGNPEIAEDVGLKGAVALKREALSEDGSYSVMIDSLNQCETLIQITNWMAANEAMVEALDDVHRRRFEMARDLRESLILEMDRASA